ncbi:MAG: cation transporter [Gemmatimonadetes bacterium]|nr:cation transporter [Gemmatimonadota bacterium]
MNNRIERNAIITGVVVGMMMAAAGWLAYYLSGAEALLLDGNFSFIGVLATLLGLRISSIKKRTSKTYPFGKFVYEPTYSFFIGLLTVGVILAAVAGNVTKITKYFQGEQFPIIDTSVILVYTIVMVVLCFGLAVLFAYSNRRLKGNSTILGAYTVQSTIDGLLSAGAGGALILFGFASPDGTFGFLTQIGDALTVLLLCLLVMYQPIKLIKDSFIELSGGALNDPIVTDKIRSVVSEHIENTEIADLFISKTGSGYLVVAFMKAGFFGKHNSQKLLRSCFKIMR